MTRIEPFADRVKRLAREGDTSVNLVAHAAWDPAVPGTSVDTLNKAMRGKRHPGRKLIEHMAGALDVDPWQFPEYQLATLRDALDERQVGLEAAVENMRRLIRPLRPGQLLEQLEQDQEEFDRQELERAEAAGSARRDAGPGGRRP